MAMPAIGGCWWPLNFEPGWMHELARWRPTTWTMQAFNDLMIRNQPLSAKLLALAAAIGIGAIFLAIGLVRFIWKTFERRSMRPGGYTALDHSARLSAEQKLALLTWAAMPTASAH